MTEKLTRNLTRELQHKVSYNELIVSIIWLTRSIEELQGILEVVLNSKMFPIFSTNFREVIEHYNCSCELIENLKTLLDMKVKKGGEGV